MPVGAVANEQNEREAVPLLPIDPNDGTQLSDKPLLSPGRGGLALGGADRLVESLREMASRLERGDPLDDATAIAPLARYDSRDELESRVNGAIARCG